MRIDFLMLNDLNSNQDAFDGNSLGKTYLIPTHVMNPLLSIYTLEVIRETVLATLNEPNKDNSYGENRFLPHRQYKDGNTKGRFTNSINR